MSSTKDEAVGCPNSLPPLWNELISLRLQSAAAGLLHDIFQGVSYGEAKMRGRLGQTLHAGIREEAMALIGDADGTVRFDRLHFESIAIEHVKACCRNDVS